MEIVSMLTTRNYTKGNNKQNKYIIIHYVGAVSSARANGNYFKTTYRGASAHYFVDEKEIVQVVRERDIAWHVGANKYKHPYCRNSNSLGIEMCCYRKSDGSLGVSDKVEQKTIELTKELMAKYNIPAENVLRHYDVTGKNCPAPMVADSARWNRFKAKLSGKANIKYEVHIEKIGWQEQKENGELAGTEGQAKRIEAIKIHADVPLEYSVHMEGLGDSEFVKNGELAGTIGQSRRIEAITIKCESHEIKADAHIQDIGWVETVVGHEITIGTKGRALRLEALKLELV